MKNALQDKQLKNVIFVSMTSICLVFALASVFFFQNYKFNVSRDIDLFMGKTQLVSSAFPHEYSIPGKYTCDGEDINPPLSIRNLPKETESIAIVFEDLSSPKNATHWTIWNINPDIVDIEENQIPIGATEGLNDFDKVGYTGPCQNKTEHEYRFKVFVLSNVTELNPSTTKEKLIEEISPYIIEEAELIGTY